MLTISEYEELGVIHLYSTDLYQNSLTRTNLISGCGFDHSGEGKDG